jgi:hypothetical protein
LEDWRKSLLAVLNVENVFGFKIWSSAFIDKLGFYSIYNHLPPSPHGKLLLQEKLDFK